ncbi:MAG: D-alanine--D-alanine ligase [Magnetococcales bacterium]|nr:D-alanine--D-alanine ligase [Magnetococcales bacterium]
MTLNNTSKKIGVLMGGVSEERPVSLNSGRAMAAALVRQGYDVVSIDVDRNLAQTLINTPIDVAVLALHGPLGEDGTVQGLLEIMGIPYTSPGVTASAVCMDKPMAKRLFRDGGIKTPAWITLEIDNSTSLNQALAACDALPAPWFVKPCGSGSSVGVTRVEDRGMLQSALESAAEVSSHVLVEQEVRGAELACAVLSGEVLPLIEIRPKDGIYDYENKYTAGRTDYLIPPPDMSQSTIQAASDAALAAYKVTGCRGLSRVDVLVDADDQPWVLEVNTIPGMTETSLVPKAAAAAGMGFDDLVERILQSAALG